MSVSDARGVAAGGRGGRRERERRSGERDQKRDRRGANGLSGSCRLRQDPGHRLLEPVAGELVAAERDDSALAVDHERLGNAVVPNAFTKLPLTSRTTG